MQTQAPQPQLAKFTKRGLIIKDHNFYKGSDNLWNNLAHFDNKIYSQFHKRNNMQQSIVDQKLLQEQLDHKFMEEFRKKDFMNKKSEDHSRYYQRIQERELVQTKAHQNSENMGFYGDFGTEDAIDEFVAKKVNASRYTRLNENAWNWHNGLSRKHVDQLLTPAVLKGEEYRIKTVKKALEIGQLEKTIQEQRKHDMQQEIRESFATRREQNLQVHKQVGIPSRSADAQGFIRNLEINERDTRDTTPPETTNTLQNRLNTDRESVSAAAPLNFDRRDTKASVNESFRTNHHRLARSSIDDPLFQRLAVPKKETVKTFDSAQTELKGSFIKNMDREIFVPENEFCKALVTKSRVCQEAHEDRRTTGRRTTYTKSVRNQSLPPIEDESYSIRDSTIGDALPKETEKVVINIEDSSSFPVVNQPFISTPVIDRGSRVRRDVLDEISDFEKRFSSMSIKSGFSRKELEQTYKSLLPNSIQKELIKQKVIRRPSHKSSNEELEQENS